MNRKERRQKKQAKATDNTLKVFSKEEFDRKIETVQKQMKAYTWRELETTGKFDKNGKLSFIKEDTLIVGCDIGSEKHYVRAIDYRGIELSKGAFSFDNSLEGFKKARDWMLELAATSEKKQIVMGLEPTGHYWFCIAAWMITNGITVVQVNPYAVKQTKEVEDNSQLKSDPKDPKPIANLVKDGNFGMPYIPEGIYADIRRLSMFRDQLTEDRTRTMNRLHREMKIYFPEYMDAFGKLDGAFTFAVLAKAPLPEDIMKLGPDGIRNIWHEAKLRGRGYSRANDIVRYAESSVGLKDGTASGKQAIQWFVKQATELAAQLDVTEEELHKKCREIPYAGNILEIKGIGEDILSGILSEMGDIHRFDAVKEIQKISGLGLVAASSGKHKGETKISRRGRKRLRYWLFQAAKSCVAHAEEFQALHVYYTTRAKNPLKKMQSLIAIACKLLRIIYMMLVTGRKYDSEKMLSDIRHPEEAEPQAA